MVNMLKRMRNFQEILDIRIGPGAIIMPPEVKRLHLSFATKINDGHMGPRKFWRLYLPRLKFHNPAVPMTVERSTDQQGPAVLTVTFAERSPEGVVAASQVEAAQAHADLGRTESIDMKHKHERDILAEFERLVQGQRVEATAAEREVLQNLKEQRERSDQDRELQAEVVRKKKREQEILEQAKRSVEGTA